MLYQDLVNQVLTSISEALNLQEDIQLTTDFDSLALDSLDKAQISAELEDALDRDIGIEELIPLKTPGDVVDYLAKELNVETDTERSSNAGRLITSEQAV